MNILFLKGFNNYFNRIIVKYDTLLEYTERKGYILNSNGTKYFIDVKNSPEDVKMTEIK